MKVLEYITRPTMRKKSATMRCDVEYRFWPVAVSEWWFMFRLVLLKSPLIPRKKGDISK